MVSPELLLQLRFLCGVEPAGVIVYVNSRLWFGREDIILRPKAGDRGCHQEQYQEEKSLTHK